MPRTLKTNPALYAFDAGLRAQYGTLCGVDEAGRGPLCGPVACAAVILDPDQPIAGINDSKKLSEARREELYAHITQKALAWHVALVEAPRIDEINILQATMEGMTKAVQALAQKPAYVIIDGNRCPPALTALGYKTQAVVKGDATSASIAAASILAKVTRDRILLQLDQQYPQYKLAQHKGYGTALHYEMIEKYGIQPFYRRSFLKKLGY